ncbi:MAG: family 14 glycosylhydrolase [Armatimonadota bacterium]
MMTRCLIISVLLASMLSAAHSERIWIEAEDATARNFEGPMTFPGVVSDDKILRLWNDADPKAGGYTASWEFTVSKSGAFHIWTSPSLPPATSNFWWKIDGGKYHHVTDQVDTRESKMFGVSSIQCWLELSKMELSQGKHTLTIMVNERRTMLEKAYLLYLDALLVTDEDITPDGLVTPADVPALAKKPVVVVEPVHRAGKPGKPMVMGSSVMSASQNLLMKKLGFTMLQTDSDHLATNQIAPGVWDWQAADSGLTACKRAGIGWQYFPHFQWANEWLKKTDKYIPSKCIEHGWEIGAMSVWSPYLNELIDDGYKAMVDHYGSGDDKVKAIYLCIHGDFGETIFPLGFHPDEMRRFGKEGSGHNDWWCGDPFARRDFKAALKAKYGTISALNISWGTKFTSFGDVDYPLPVKTLTTAEERRRWLDFLHWYNGSMTRLTEDVSRIARNRFPKSLLQIPIGGGDVNVLYGTDHTAYAKIAKKYGIHIRSTHGGYLPVPQNYATMLKLIATSCKFYKVPFWSEPPSNITAEGEVGRFFESISCGSYGFWDWGSNPVASPNVFRKYKAFLTRENPVVDVALFWPTTNIHLHPETTMPVRFVEGAAAIRDVMDYDIVDENLVNDGALKSYRVLVLFEGQYVDPQSLKQIESWVKSGGVLVSCNYGPVSDVDGDTSAWRRLFGVADSSVTGAGGVIEPKSDMLRYSKNVMSDMTIGSLAPDVTVLGQIDGRPAIWARRIGKGYGVYYAGTWESKMGYFQLIRDITYNLSALDNRLKNAVEVDKDWDGVYCTLLPSKEVIVYNHNKTPVEKKIGDKTLKMEPVSLGSIMLDRK